MPAVAGDEEVGRWRRDGPERAGGDGDEAVTAPARPPETDPQAPGDDQGEGGRRHGGEQGDGAGGTGGGMSEPEQEGERLAGQPPERRAEADQVEEQGKRLQRHDDEGGERDGDDVGERAVEAGLVEMEQGDRRQRDLDGEAGEDKGEERPARFGRPAFVAAREPGLGARIFVQRDDRDDGGEAHLEARAGERFRPEQEHDQRADRDQAKGDRLAAQGNAGKDEQRRDAGADGRHLRAGQQGIGDAGERARGGGDQDEAEAQRERGAQREQLEASAA